MPNTDEPKSRLDTIRSSIDRWASPIMMGVIAWFAKEKMEAFERKLDLVIVSVPVLQQKFLDLERRLENQERLINENNSDIQELQKYYFLKPEDVIIKPRKN